MSFIPFEFKGKTVTKSVFDASCLAVTSYAENAEIIGKALAIQCLVEGNAKPANTFFEHSSFKKADGKMNVRAMRLARYIESLTYGYMRIGREGQFALVVGKKEKTAKRGFYMLGDKADDIPTWPVVLHDGRPKPEEVASLVVHVHGFTEFEEFQPVIERPSTEVSAISEAVTLRKFNAIVDFFNGKNIENLSVENRDKLVGMCDTLLGVVVNASGRPLEGINADGVKLDGNNVGNIVNTSPRSRVALETEVKNLNEQVRILQSLEPESLRKQRDAAQVEADMLAQEIALKNDVMRWQAEVIRLMREGKAFTSAMDTLKSYEDKLRYLAGDDSIPNVEVNERATEKVDSSELSEVARLRTKLCELDSEAKPEKIRAEFAKLDIPVLTIPKARNLIKIAYNGDFSELYATYMDNVAKSSEVGKQLDGTEILTEKQDSQPAA